MNKYICVLDSIISASVRIQHPSSTKKFVKAEMTTFTCTCSYEFQQPWMVYAGVYSKAGTSYNSGCQKAIDNVWKNAPNLPIIEADKIASEGIGSNYCEVW